MAEYILLAAMAVFVVALFFLRTHTAIVFFALCAGSVLVEATGADLGLVASSLSSGLTVSTDIVRVVTLLLPAVITALLLRGLLSRGKSALGLIPGIASAMLGASLVVPLLSKSVQDQIGKTDTWKLLGQYQEFIVAFGLVISVVMIAITIKKPHDKDAHKKGRH
jgi:hypothetical protein